jgi:hypothetical protein
MTPSPPAEPSPPAFELPPAANPLSPAGPVALLGTALGLLIAGGAARLLTPLLLLAAGAWAVVGRERGVRLDALGVEVRRWLLRPQRLGWDALAAVRAEGRGPDTLALVFHGGRVRLRLPPGGFGPILELLAGAPLDAAVRHALDVRERAHEVHFGRLGLRTRELVHRGSDERLPLEQLGGVRVVPSPAGARLQVERVDGGAFADEPLEDVKNFPVLVRLLARERRQPLAPGWWVEAPSPPPRPPRRRLDIADLFSRALLGILPLMGFIMGCGMLVLGLHLLWEGVTSYGWTRVPGQVLRSEPVPNPLTRRDPPPAPNTRFEYTYTYDGATYRGRRVELQTPDNELPASVAERYPAGATPDVWVKPREPETAVLEPGIGWKPVGFILMGLLMVVVFGALLLSLIQDGGRKRWRTRP